MTYKSLESQIKSIMSETRRSAGKKMLDDWQRRVNAAVDKLQQPTKDKEEKKD